MSRHEPGTPMGGSHGGAFQCGHHHLFHLLVAHLAGRSRTGFIEQSIDPFLQEALAPMADRLFMGVEPMGDLQITLALSTRQNDPRPKSQGPGTAHPAGQNLERFTLFIS
jgi:hypothetical protein